MAEYLSVLTQSVALNNPIVFTDSIPCTKGCVYHEDGTGIFILRGITNNCFARYQVTYNGNINVPEGGTVTAIGLALSVNGEERPSSLAIFYPQAVSEPGNVTSTAIVTVPKGCCFSVAVRYVDATTSDPATTPTPVIEVANSNLVITRIA
jgi:hypothetical protein